MHGSKDLRHILGAYKLVLLGVFGVKKVVKVTEMDEKDRLKSIEQSLREATDDEKVRVEDNKVYVKQPGVIMEFPDGSKHPMNDYEVVFTIVLKEELELEICANPIGSIPCVDCHDKICAGDHDELLKERLKAYDAVSALDIVTAAVSTYTHKGYEYPEDCAKRTCHCGSFEKKLPCTKKFDLAYIDGKLMCANCYSKLKKNKNENEVENQEYYFKGDVKNPELWCGEGDQAKKVE